MFGENAAVVVLLLSGLVTGCSSSPGSLIARSSETGRLLQDGPQSLMTSANISAERQNDVPILYEFAIEANAVKPWAVAPGGGQVSGFPASDIASQQIALSLVSAAGWRDITRVGEGRIDRNCTQFISALYALEKEKKATLANMNAIQSATVGIMGLAMAAQEAIGITGVAFGLGSSLFDNTTSAVLYQMPAQSITSIVLAQRTVLRTDEDKALAQVTNQGMAAARLAEYIRYCIPVTIEANISNVLGNAKAGKDGTIETSSTQAAVKSSALATPISGISTDKSNIVSNLRPTTGAAPIKTRPGPDVDTWSKTFDTTIDNLTNHATLERIAIELKLPLDRLAAGQSSTVSQLDPLLLKKLIKSEAFSEVEQAADHGAEIASLKKRLDPIIAGN
jgi:hypothetical protein